jgi:hypothetical protein
MTKSSKSSDATDIYTALGRALNAWSGIEYDLCGVFCDCLNPQNASPADRAYWAVISFDARLEMVSEVIRGRFSHKPKIVEQWDAVREHLKKRVRQRNKLAHATVIRMSNYNRKQSPPDLFLSPFHWSERAANRPTMAQMQSPRYDARPKDRLYPKGIDGIRASFHEALLEIRAFRKAAWQIILQEERREQDGAERHLRKLLSQEARQSPADIALLSGSLDE